MPEAQRHYFMGNGRAASEARIMCINIMRLHRWIAESHRGASSLGAAQRIACGCSCESHCLAAIALQSDGAADCGAMLRQLEAERGAMLRQLEAERPSAL
jgi:hypothetical protein